LAPFPPTRIGHLLLSLRELLEVEKLFQGEEFRRKGESLRLPLGSQGEGLNLSRRREREVIRLLLHLDLRGGEDQGGISSSYGSLE